MDITDFMKPNFLIIGAGRCGTTSLCHYLAQHPDVFIYKQKETEFFNLDRLYAEGQQWYESLFEKGRGHKAVGEGTVNYSKQHRYPKTASRISRHLPDARLIYITRHPLRQLESNWKYAYLHGHEPKPFNRAIKENVDYLKTGNYLRQIQAYRRFYPDDRILILFLEEMISDPTLVLKKCAGFLEIDNRFGDIDVTPRNRTIDDSGDRWVLSLSKKMPGYNRLRNSAPVRLKTIFKSILKWQIRDAVQWDKKVRKWVIDEIYEDTQRFLERYGKVPDFWSFETSTHGM